MSLLLSLRTKAQNVIIQRVQMKAAKQSLAVILFIMVYEVAPTLRL